MSLLQKFKDHWQQQFPQVTPDNCQLLLAVSGGADSVVLTDLLVKTGFSFTIAHVNFQLRGAESTRDEIFVRSLGEKYKVEVLVKQVDTQEYASRHKIAIQEAARDLRYEWFREIAGAVGSQKDSKSENNKPSSRLPDFPTSIYILTAHHADDNIETVLMNFFRGTGIQGMTGIRPCQPDRSLLRPLLPFRKQELLNYAETNGLAFVEDSSNASDAYTRNFFRNRLLPQIKEIFPQVEENLLHNVARFSDVAQLYEKTVAQLLEKLVEPKGTEWHIPVLKWKKTQPLHTITWELIRSYGFSAAQTGEVIKLLDAANGSYVASGTYRIIKNRKWMIISPLVSETAQHILVEEGNGTVVFENGRLAISKTGNEQRLTTDPAEAFLNSADIQFPLLLRKWKQGDYFYPLGMQKKKKVSRFLIDLKLSKTDKEKVWVLESDKKILWVIGYRIDNRFRITENTKEVLHLQIKH